MKRVGLRVVNLSCNATKPSYIVTAVKIMFVCLFIFNLGEKAVEIELSIEIEVPLG